MHVYAHLWICVYPYTAQRNRTQRFSTTRARFDEAREELWRLISSEKVQGVVLLILANKQV